MTPYRRFKADRKAKDSILTMGGALLALCLLVVAGIAIANNWEVSAESVDQAEMGSSVSVNFVGSYSNGYVFDTTLYSVASDPQILKSFEFNARSQYEYAPTQFKIGSNKLLTGFESAVIGMRPGETNTVTLSPTEAYGLVPEENLRNFTINQTLSIIESMSFSEFRSFYGQDASEGLTVSHPEYGWDVTVLPQDSAKPADVVQVQNNPAVGEVYSAYGDPSNTSPTGWHVKVISKDGGEILFVNMLVPSMVDKIKGVDAAGEIFYLCAVDESSFTLKYAKELVGRTLTFTITLVKII